MLAKAPTLTHGSLFTGVGGFNLAFQSLGIPTCWMVEIEPYSQAVLRKHFPGVPLHGDIRGVGAKNLAGVDIISGGFPCQPFSQAGKRKGKADARHLWPEMFRVVVEVRPRWVVAENVRGILSDDGGRIHDRVCTDLEAEGYEVETFVLPAVAFGAPHERERIWIVARDDAYGYGDFGKDVAGARPEQFVAPLPPIVQGTLEETDEIWDCWKHELGTRNVGQDGSATEPEADAYARGVRAAHGIPGWAHRLKACGNAVVPQVAAWIAMQILRHEQDAARCDGKGGRHGN